MRVYLDDERKTPIGWMRAHTADEAIAYLETGRVEEISLDHDLEEAHYFGNYDIGKTGHYVLFWLKSRVENDPEFKMPLVRLHTFNEKRKPMMKETLREIRQIIMERQHAKS